MASENGQKVQLDMPIATPKPIYAQSGPLGMLALHGYTGAPAEMSLLCEHMHAQGWTVSAPLLPGHGTDPAELNRLSWQDWLAGAQGALDQLSAACETVFVAGLSMGALLACVLAQANPSVAGLLLYSPALQVANPWIRFAGLARWIIPYFPPEDPDQTDLVDPEAPSRLWHYPAYPVGGAAQLFKLQRVVKQSLPDLETPALVVASTRDASLHPESARMLYDRLGSVHKRFILLHNSGHCLTVDIERERVFEASLGFALEVIGQT